VDVLVAPAGALDIPLRLGKGGRVEDDHVVEFLRAAKVLKDIAANHRMGSGEKPFRVKWVAAASFAAAEASTETTCAAPPRAA
jgi:hypothetical protein